MGAGVETCEFPMIALALAVEGELSTCEECRGNWILHWSWLGVESWKLELISLPYSVPFTYRQFFLILISLRMVPASMSFHLSFKRIESLSLSSGERSGLTKKGWLKVPLLDKILDTSVVLTSLTRMGLGRWREGLNFPRRKQSLIDRG